jgi:23S rRNA pseudouridine2605 synthase
MERLQKYLARAGLASRRHAEALITAGRVKVNGQVVTVLGTRIAPGKDSVAVDGRPVEASRERHWFLFYKPPGVVTTLSDPQGRVTIADFTKATGLRVFPVGRLDFDAEGALLLTDDGETANKLMHPRHRVPRVYLAKVKGEPDAESLQRLVKGVRLEDGMAQAVEAAIYEKADRNVWLKLVVTEGRQHLVKRLCAAIGHPVVRLFRPAHAGLSVKGLRPGELRPLTAEEVRRVKALAEGRLMPEPELSLPARRHGRSLCRSADESDDAAWVSRHGEKRSPGQGPRGPTRREHPAHRAKGVEGGGFTSGRRSGGYARSGGRPGGAGKRPSSDGLRSKPRR